MTVTTTKRVLLTVDCVGGPRERGRAHGEVLRESIADGLGRWMEAIARRQGMDPDAYVAEFLAATEFLPAIRRWTPDLEVEIAGIAEGADQPLARMLAFNLLDEEWEFAKARAALAPGCTVACLTHGETGAPVLAQTMDIPQLHDSTQTVLRMRPEDGPEQLVLAFAGAIGLNGCNAAGVGVVVNNLEVLTSSPRGLPVAFVTRGILARPTLAAAAEFVQAVPHATGQHYAIGDPTGLRAFEGWGGGVAELPIDGDSYAHANHPLGADDLRGDPEPAYAGSHTRERYACACAGVAEATSQTAIEAVLNDETAPISLTARGGYMTFAAVSMELSTPPRFRVAPGPPHQTPWQQVLFTNS
ncbi:MAG: 6-aminopenicillanic acid acyl-transferase [Thermomicrobiales bacterium]|nr:6-aminopenicillanic acid acyl-transferase [Thermomicrobiales bacterium]